MSWQGLRDQATLIRTARDILTEEELTVWLTKHISGKGRRAGSLALGITEDAWRYRLQRANRKIIQHLEKEAA